MTTAFDDGAIASDGTSGADDPTRETLTWEGFGVASRELTAQIVRSGWMPDLIIAIARGGLLPAGAISYAMGVKAMGTMNVEFYTGIGETLEEPQLLPPLMDVSAMFGKKVLVVDDVADTGHTLRLVREVLAQHVDEARTAVLYHKSHSVIVPDYCWKPTDAWINFPWSVLPPVAGLPPR